MAQEHQIKVYAFPAVTATAANVSAQYSNHPIRGKIQKVEYSPAVTDSSAWLGYSGTSEVVSYFASGTSGTTSIIYPRVKINDVSGTSMAGSAFDYFLSDALPMFVVGSGFTSGATAYGFLRVYYE